jgi:hypothetical protein
LSGEEALLMIYGAHPLIYSRAPEEARAIVATVLGPTDTVDAGGGWLIFALPPSEIAVHPTDGSPGVDLSSCARTSRKPSWPFERRA